MKEWIARYKSSAFIRNVFTLAAGSGLAQIISIAFSPILSRLFDSGEFAVYAVFFSWVQQISVGAALRMEIAIPLPAEDKEAVGLTRLAIRIALITTMLTMLGVLFWWFAASAYGFDPLPGFYVLLPFTMLTSVLMQVFNFLSTRWGSFRYNAAARIISNVVIALVSCFLGWMEWGAVGLVLGLFAGQSIGVLFMFFSVRKRLKQFGNEQNHLPGYNKGLLKKYKEFIWINTPHALIDTLQLSGTVWMLHAFFSDDAVGWFFLSWRVLKMPLTFVGSAVYQVFYSKASQEYRQGKNLRSSIRKIYLQMFLLGLPVCLVLLAFGPSLFAFVFGEEWRGAGEMSRILSIWLFANFIVSPVSCMAMIAGKQKQAFLIAIAEHGTRLIALAIGGVYQNLELALLLTAASGTLMMVLMMYWYSRIAEATVEA